MCVEIECQFSKVIGFFVNTIVQQEHSEIYVDHHDKRVRGRRIRTFL